MSQTEDLTHFDELMQVRTGNQGAGMQAALRPPSNSQLKKDPYIFSDLDQLYQNQLEAISDLSECSQIIETLNNYLFGHPSIPSATDKREQPSGRLPNIAAAQGAINYTVDSIKKQLNQLRLDLLGSI